MSSEETLVTAEPGGGKPGGAVGTADLQPHRGRVLVVDDEPEICEICSRALLRSGFTVETAEDGAEAVKKLREAGGFDTVLTDLAMPGMGGLDLLREVKGLDPDTEVIIMTAHGTIEAAIEAMRRGALDFVTKPFNLDELVMTVEKASEKKALRDEVRSLRRELSDRYRFGRLVGKSDALRTIYALVEKFGPTPSSVLIHGESGTGKEVIARAIHSASPRRDGPFVPVNCAAIVREIFESELFGHVRGAFTGAVGDKLGFFRVASGGTLFLDEVAEMPSAVQVKLLRALQDREVVPVGSSTPVKVDVRIVSATNRDLKNALAKGDLREDLYYRLNVVEIAIPPLRERREDIPVLASHFVEVFGERMGRAVRGITPEAMNALLKFGWAGNVRELENAIEFAVTLSSGSEVRLSDLPARVRDPEVVAATGGETLVTLEELERIHIRRVLEATGGHRGNASRILGIDPKTLYRKIKEYGMVGMEGED